MIKNQKVHVIWTSEIDYDGFVKELRKELPNADDDYLRILAREINNTTLDDERLNLDFELPEEIVEIHAYGCKRIGSRNLKDCLESDCIDVTWYCDRYNFKFYGRYHDGENRATYRMFREGLEDWQKRGFVNGKMGSKFVNKYTKSVLPYIARRYNWTLKGV